MAQRQSFFAELKRRNVLRAAVLYVGAVWALAQGIAQLARTSTANYASHPEDLKVIGQQLGVATILEGSVQK
ncbi:MAG: hypothetical protein ACREP0_09435 [Rhodanobacteraceae bacterium]